MLGPDTILEGRYRIVRQCERLSTCVVYEAIDERLGGQVALREWEVGGAEASREAFVREAQLLNSVFHVALPYVSDMFSTPDGWYHVSQWIPGGPLSAELASATKPFEMAQVSVWLERVLSVLDFFHSLSPPVVVANVCPAALHISPQGDALLVDMGFAVEDGEPAIGYTLPYAPIEQIQGRPLGPRSDVYSVGATAYHLLTLFPPPNAHERVSGWEGGGRTTVLRSLEELNSSITPEVATVIYRAMAVRSEERFATAAEMHAALFEAYSVPGSTLRLVEGRDPTKALDIDELDTTEVASAPPPQVEQRVVSTEIVPIQGLVDDTESRGPKTSVVCRKCGSVNDSAQKFCPRCGEALKQPQPVPAMVDDWVDAETTVSVAAPSQSNTLDLAIKPIAEVDNRVDSQASTAELVRQRAYFHVLEGEDPGAVLELSAGATLIGRAEGAYTFPLDIFMSGRHARVERKTGRFVLVDEASRNGTFVRLRSEVKLEPGDTILVGKQLLRFELSKGSQRPVIGLVRKTGTVAQYYDVKPVEMTIGRGRSDINFPDDQSMADRHVRITTRDGGCFVADNGTKNGTFLRMRHEVTLENGDVIIIGKHIFRFELLGSQHSTLES